MELNWKTPGRFEVRPHQTDVEKKDEIMKIALEPMNVDNWLIVCDMAVSEEQKKIYPIPNVYWIGISRYEEHTELFAIKSGNDYVGMIGAGYDEDCVTGFINPLMIDAQHQRKGYAREALKLIIQYLVDNLKVNKINIGHRKENTAAANLYKTLGFTYEKEDDDDFFITKKL